MVRRGLASIVWRGGVDAHGTLARLPVGELPDLAMMAVIGNDDGVHRTLLIVDDHARFRGFARALLEAGGFEVVGEAADGATALAAVRKLRPDIVLLDVVLSDEDGFALCEQIAREHLHSRPIVVLTSTRDATSYGDRVARSSARAFISKTELTAATLTALMR